MMWRFVNALWFLLVFTATVELATSQNSTVVRTTKEFSKALYDTRIDAIYLQHPLTVSGEEWGFLRPDVKRRVEIRPLEHTEDFVLDLGGGSDLAFVSGPSGELHFHDLQLHGIYRLALGGYGSGGAGIIMNLFRVNAPQSIHIHNSTCCFPPEVCTSISDDLRVIVPSSKAALSALDVDSCPFPDAEEPFHTYKYYEGCVLPQEWDASKITGSIHFHNTSLSCSEKCKMNDRLQDIPVVQVSTSDSRQLVVDLCRFRGRHRRTGGQRGDRIRGWDGSADKICPRILVKQRDGKLTSPMSVIQGAADPTRPPTNPGPHILAPQSARGSGPRLGSEGKKGKEAKEAKDSTWRSRQERATSREEGRWISRRRNKARGGVILFQEAKEEKKKGSPWRSRRERATSRKERLWISGRRNNKVVSNRYYSWIFRGGREKVGRDRRRGRERSTKGGGDGGSRGALFWSYKEDSAVGCLRSQGAPLQRIVPPVKLAKRIVLVALFWSPAFYEASSRGLEGGFKRGASTGAIAVEEKVVLLLLRRFVSNDDWELGEAEAGCEVPCRTQRVLWGDTGVRVLVGRNCFPAGD
ncbi:hypothetical protein BSKO_02616 [Bryopsis sp. KO-2023]|nr:hypothetical protein BSKO_02616 [Bryopsis sp. KO-2023]